MGSKRTITKKELIRELEVMHLATGGFIDNLKTDYYERTVHEGEAVKKRIQSELHELITGYKKISWSLALKELKEEDKE